jgi:ferredoxin
VAAREPDNPRIVDVVVEPDICCRFMNCVRIAGRAFRMSKDTGKSSPARWQDVDPALLWQASRSCPTGAIRIVTDDGYVVPRWQETDGWSMDKHPAAARPHDRAREPYKGMT